MKFKKESYIKQSQTSFGTWNFEVRIPKMNIDKTFSEKRFGSARNAYNMAVQFRNKALLGTRQKDSIVSTKNVLIESYSLFPVRDETKRKHLMYFNKYVVNKNLVISKITKADIIQSLNKASTEQTDDNISRLMSIWRRIFKTALVQGYVSIDLSQSVIVPKSQVVKNIQKKDILSREELENLFMKIDTYFPKNESMSVKMALNVMWYTGMRPSECFALLKSDIKDGHISVSKQLGSSMANSEEDVVSRNMVVRTCKTKTSIRKIPISDTLQKLLDDYHVKGEIMFPNAFGTYYDTNSLGARLHRYDKNFHMYQIRHTVATHLIVDCGADERTIREILGHENINMSVYYARSNDEKKKTVLDTI